MSKPFEGNMVFGITIKLTCENFVSKGGSTFEILPKIQRGYVNAGYSVIGMHHLIKVADRYVCQIQITDIIIIILGIYITPIHVNMLLGAEQLKENLLKSIQL